ncbi:MAG: hypothetical protein ACQXXG_00485 [Candidatus Bathyarchaeia archaeon]|nr:hypothetical protein [Candidatus Bathyarchaeota archaeon A05DMB-3]
MKFGSFLFSPETVEGFDIHVYRLKPETGTIGTPKEGMYNNIACFGDNTNALKHPEWVSISKDGPALRTNKRYNFRWDILCMTNPEYREWILGFIENAAKVASGITLSSIHFADHGFCVCSRCVELWRQSGLNWMEWRTQTVTKFIEEASERVKKWDKPFLVGLLPDPVLSKERFGIDFDALAPYADAFIVPIFSKSYATPWHFETLARSLKSVLKKPVYINIYVYGPGDNPKEVPTVSELLKVSARVCRTGVDGVLFLAENAQRLRDFQKAALQAEDVLKEIEDYGADEFLKLIDKWRNLS